MELCGSFTCVWTVRRSIEPCGFYIDGDILWEDDEQKIVAGTLKDAFLCPAYCGNYDTNLSLKPRVYIGDMIDSDTEVTGAAFDRIQEQGNTTCIDWLHGGNVYIEPVFRGHRLGQFAMRELILTFGQNAITTIVIRDETPSLLDYWTAFGFKQESPTILVHVGEYAPPKGSYLDVPSPRTIYSQSLRAG